MNFTDADVWFQQTFKKRDNPNPTALMNLAKEYEATHEFIPPPLPASCEAGYVDGCRVPCRLVKAWNALRDEILVRFDIIGHLRPGVFFAKSVYEPSIVPGYMIMIWFKNLPAYGVTLKDWLEGDYSFTF